MAKLNKAKIAPMMANLPTRMEARWVLVVVWPEWSGLSFLGDSIV